jgi:hypothetical protein
VPTGWHPDRWHFRRCLDTCPLHEAYKYLSSNLLQIVIDRRPLLERVLLKGGHAPTIEQQHCERVLSK